MSVVLHSFSLGDVEDPEIYAAEPIIQWERSLAGEWAQEFAGDLRYTIALDPHTWGYRVDIVGDLDEAHYLEFVLRWR